MIIREIEGTRGRWRQATAVHGTSLQRLKKQPSPDASGNAHIRAPDHPHPKLRGPELYGRQDVRQVEASQPPRDRRADARAASLLLLRHGSRPRSRSTSPFVGVASCWNEAAPCNIALMRQAQSAKKGVDEAGGTPREFCTITVTDGIAMGHQGMKSSLVSREVIADSVELTMRGHCYDALVGIAGCDKSLPGMMMAMLRLNVPSRLHVWRLDPARPVPGHGRHRRRRVRRRRHALRRQDVGARICTISNASPARARARAAASSPPTPWPASSEAIGLALPIRPARRRPTRAATTSRWQAAKPVMELLARNIRPRDIATRKAFENAARRRRRDRRLDQCRAASAGDGERGRHRVRPVRRRRDLQDARPTSPTSSPAANTSPRTCTRPAACRC